MRSQGMSRGSVTELERYRCKARRPWAGGGPPGLGFRHSTALLHQQLPQESGWCPHAAGHCHYSAWMHKFRDVSHADGPKWQIQSFHVFSNPSSHGIATMSWDNQAQISYATYWIFPANSLIPVHQRKVEREKNLRNIYQTLSSMTAKKSWDFCE